MATRHLIQNVRVFTKAQDIGIDQYVVLGSTALFLCGFDIEANDVDIAFTPEVFERLKKDGILKPVKANSLKYVLPSMGLDAGQDQLQANLGWNIEDFMKLSTVTDGVHHLTLEGLEQFYKDLDMIYSEPGHKASKYAKRLSQIKVLSEEIKKHGALSPGKLRLNREPSSKNDSVFNGIHIPS